jgi:nitrogen fixation NifU-like protein
MFSPAVLDHFQNPRNAGLPADATAMVEVTNPVCGDILQLAVRTDDKHIVAAGFKARGCVTAMACASFLTEFLIGKAKKDSASISAEQIADALGGLPAASFHGSQLAAEAAHMLLEKLP